jgi:hypothetical protein
VCSTDTGILDYFVYFLLKIKEQIYTNILLISDGPVSFYLGGDKADVCERRCVLPPANLFFTSVCSTGPLPTVSEDVQ